MSGPVTGADEPVVADDAAADVDVPAFEVHQSRSANVGGLGVARALPRRDRRTVGAWCFADHFGPAEVRTASMQVGPHPHIGLHTATWLLAGEVVHHDSLGSEQPIRPGQLNLMTAGRGVAHAEETPERGVDVLEGIQLWIAQPDATRRGPASFAHHGDLPRSSFAAADVTVFVGAVDTAASPAEVDVDLVGAEIAFTGSEPSVLPLRAGFEHALMTLGADLAIDGEMVPREALVYLGVGREEIELSWAAGGASVLLLGGAPFEEQLLMWWNFVGRTRDEIESAYRDWQDGAERYGEVDSGLARISAPRPNWLPI